MPKIICVKCEVQCQILKNGVPLIEMFLDPPQPYKILSSDKWQCPICKHEILAGISEYGSEHFQEIFPKALEKAKEYNPVYSYEHKRLKE